MKLACCRCMASANVAFVEAFTVVGGEALCASCFYGRGA